MAEASGRRSQSEEARTYLDLGKIEGRRRPEEWLPLLEELVAHDKSLESRRRPWKIWGRVLKFAFFVFCFMSLFLYDAEFPVVIVWALPVLDLFLVFYCRAQGKKIVASRMYSGLSATVIPFLDAVKEDLGPKNRVGLRMDLRPAPGYLTSADHVAPWCRITTTLADGTGIGLTIVDRRKYIVQSKRSSSGRLKTKRKLKQLVSATAIVAPNGTVTTWDRTKVTAPGDAPAAAAASPNETTDKSKPELFEKNGRELCSLTIRKREVGNSMTAFPDLVFDKEEVLGMFFQILAAMLPVPQRSPANEKA